jgi:NAD(P)-dependent dehydrogenase (short-subunit alcohol dehydrogenase family)
VWQSPRMTLDRGGDRLDARVALITGAARGQGRSHALALAARGAAVAACDVPGAMTSVGYELATKVDLDETVAMVEAEGGTCIGIEADVRDAAAVDAAVRSASDALGPVDILVANAGVVSTAPLWEVDDEAWREMLETNLSGVFHSLRAVVPSMMERRWGRIVVTSSMGGRMGIPNLAAYNATKWGVIGMAKSLALEVATFGITVNVVCPCTVATPMVLHDGMYRLFAPDVDEPTPDRAGPLPAREPDPRTVDRGRGRDPRCRAPRHRSRRADRHGDGDRPRLERPPALAAGLVSAAATRCRRRGGSSRSMPTCRRRRAA